MDIRQLLSLIILISLVALSPGKLKAQSAPDSETTKKSAAAEQTEHENEERARIVERAEELKQQLIALNRELYQFEEDLLYPANTQVAVFLSISENSSFLLDSIEVLLDDKLITTHLYKEKEISALKKGGIQRLYVGSLSDGRHKLTARFNGQGANERYFRRKKSLPFVKEQDAKYIQLVVTEYEPTREPLFKVKQW